MVVSVVCQSLARVCTRLDVGFLPFEMVLVLVVLVVWSLKLMLVVVVVVLLLLVVHMMVQWAEQMIVQDQVLVLVQPLCAFEHRQ